MFQNIDSEVYFVSFMSATTTNNITTEYIP